MAEPSFCRFFKKNTGKTFIEFLNEFRITHACKLLAESDFSITDICYECGYNNFSHFNSYFKKITGKSPSEYRKLLGQMVVHEV
jgi:AraC-like DNA-binding protein